MTTTKSERSRHSSGTSSTVKRRIRANSSSSSNNHNHGEFVSSNKKLRVEVIKLKTESDSDKAAFSGNSADENESSAENRPQRKILRSRRSTGNNKSPDRKRRSELDKLLEAGSSSFHFETARAAANRTGDSLGPLQVDVSDNNSEAGSGSSAEAENGKNHRGSSRLLQEASNDMNQNSKNSKKEKRPKRPLKNSPPNRRGRKRSRRSSVKSESEADEEEEEEEEGEEEDSESEAETIPSTMLEALKRVDCSEVEISSLEYSFERTPVREGWFQTYTRQDKGDEILFYPDNQSFPLPYEMPMSTFYPKKDFKKSLFGGSEKTRAGSGTATPIPEEEENDFLAPPPTRTTRGQQKSKIKPVLSSAEEINFYDKLDPKKAAALRAAEFSRKSPRCHASTKSLLTTFNEDDDGEDDDGDEVFDDMIDHMNAPGSFMDESSNDSILSNKTESTDQFQDIAKNLDIFLCEEDTDLLATSENNSMSSKKRSRRQSSSDKSSLKKSKKSTKDETNHIDRLIDSNVDPVLLDCLEDELPSVTFDDFVPGSDPMELANTYDKCTSINLFAKKKKGPHPKKSLQQQQEKLILEQEEAEQEEINENLVICHSKDPSSTILRRLLTHPTTKKRASKKGGLNKKALKNKTAAVNNKSATADINSRNDESSSCETSSMASSCGSQKRRKKKRNMTGFPSAKKPKSKVLNSVPSTSTLKKASASARVNRLKKSATGSKKMTKKGQKQHQQKPLKLKILNNRISASSKRPPPRNRNSRVIKQRPRKQKMRKIPKRISRTAIGQKEEKEPEIVEILSSDEDDLEDDSTFKPRGGNKQIVARPSKSSRRPLTMKKVVHKTRPINVTEEANEKNSDDDEVLAASDEEDSEVEEAEAGEAEESGQEAAGDSDEDGQEEEQSSEEDESGEDESEEEVEDESEDESRKTRHSSRIK
jgi:antitoxin component of MazEF toxin-antitoxin module